MIILVVGDLLQRLVPVPDLGLVPLVVVHGLGGQAVGRRALEKGLHGER